MKKLKIALLAFLLFSAGYLTSAEITDLSVTDASNTARFPENMAPSAVNNAARALEGLLARWEKDTNGSVVAYGTGNAVRITPNRTISSLYDGLVFAAEVTAGNTGATTFQVGSLSALSIKKNHDEDLASGDLEAGQKIVVIYNSDEQVFQLIGGGKATGPSAGDGISVSGSTVSVSLTNGLGLALSQSKLRLDFNGMTTQAISGTDTFPHYNATASEVRKISGASILGLVTSLPSATPVTGDTISFADASDGHAAKQTSVNTLLSLASGTNDILIYQDQAASGTNSPTYTAGAWRTVLVDTEVTDTAGIGSLASNQVTLNAGKYQFLASVFLGLDTASSEARLRLQNITDGTTVVQGVNFGNNGAADSGYTAELFGYIDISGAKAFEIQVYTNVTTSARGAVTSGEVEVYSSITFRRYAQ